MGKEIEVVRIKAKELKFGFGNPRKISKTKKAELKRSLEINGDFGCFIIDEQYNVIGGNQRATIIREMDPDAEVLCKMLIGYSKAELRAINIKDNTHAGEWDLEALADWTAGLNIDLGFDIDDEEINNKSISEMELIHYEKYDYVLLACRDPGSYDKLTEALGLKNKVVVIGDKNHKSIRARAVWFDDAKYEIRRKEQNE